MSLFHLNLEETPVIDGHFLLLRYGNITRLDGYMEHPKLKLVL